MKLKTFLVIIALFSILYIAYRTYRILNIDKGLDKMVSKGAIILDVRTKVEFSMGHIKNALNIPMGRIRTGSIPIGKDKIIITYCSHGLRSVKAVELLKSRGYKNVYNGGAQSDLEKYLSQ